MERPPHPDVRVHGNTPGLGAESGQRSALRVLTIWARLTVIACTWWVGEIAVAQSSPSPVRHRFDLPAGDAVRTLQLFSEQSGEQILYPVEQVRGFRTRRVLGQLTARAALELMLTNTGLVAVEDEASGAFAIKRRPIDENVRPPPPPSKLQPAARQPPATPASRQPDLVVLSPFEVRSRSDTGYKAANSVSATRVAVPISELPMGITVFTEEFITDQKAYDLYDIVKWAPGVHQDNQSPQGWVRYNIRGFTSAAVQRNGFGAFRFIDTSNIARVEVVKGPASLLYGQINPGGVINYITKRPEAKPGLQLAAAIGDRGYKHALVDATGPVPHTDDRLFYRAIAMAEDIQRFQTLARGRKYLFAPSATWKLSERAAISIEFEHFERLDEMPTSGVIMRYTDRIAQGPYTGLPHDFSYAGFGDYQDFVSDVFTAEATIEVAPALTLKATYLDSYWDMDWRATGQGGTGLIAQSFIDFYYPPSAGLTSADAMFRRNRWEHQWGGERTGQIDLVGTAEFAGAKWRALFGHRRNFETRSRSLQRNNPNVAGDPAYLRPWDLRDPATWDRSVPFGLDALVWSVNTASSSEAWSHYAVVSVASSDERLRLLGGFARHTLRNHPAHNYITGRVTPASERAANIPQAGVLFRVSPEISAFASYSESFLANATLLRVDNVPTTPAEPSHGRGEEIGVKLDLWGSRLSGTISAYRVRARPTGVVTVTSGVDPDGTTLFTDVQGGKQLSEGFEFDLLFTPTTNLQVLAGFSYCDAVYERHPTTPALDGARLVATPDRTFNLWGKYTLGEGRWSGLTLAGGLNYVGRTPHIANNPARTAAAYTTFDVSLGYRIRALDREWHADVSVKNVTNERYYPSASSWGFPRHTILSIRTRF